MVKSAPKHPKIGNNWLQKYFCTLESFLKISNHVPLYNLVKPRYSVSLGQKSAFWNKCFSRFIVKTVERVFKSSSLHTLGNLHFSHKARPFMKIFKLYFLDSSDIFADNGKKGGERGKGWLDHLVAPRLSKRYLAERWDVLNGILNQVTTKLKSSLDDWSGRVRITLVYNFLYFLYFHPRSELNSG